MRCFAVNCVVGVLIVVAGCGTESTTVVPTAPAIDGSRFLLKAEPAGAQDVVTARQSAANDQDIAVIGRIGGDANPWIDGRAAFSIVDMSLKSCLETGDGCPLPWDYCCELHKLPTATAIVKFMDESGKLIAADARDLLHVKELDTVVVQGKVQRDDAGNLTLIASGLFKK